MADNDPLSAALKRTFSAPQGGSYFPAVRNLMASERGDLLKETEDTFYGGGQSPTGSPTPSPSPSPVKPTQMNLAQLYDHFGVEQRPSQQWNTAPFTTTRKGNSFSISNTGRSFSEILDNQEQLIDLAFGAFPDRAAQMREQIRQVRMARSLDAPTYAYEQYSSRPI